jgi:hypothetical protein
MQATTLTLRFGCQIRCSRTNGPGGNNGAGYRDVQHDGVRGVEEGQLHRSVAVHADSSQGTA